MIGPASTEDDLLARARAGDVDAFAVIVRAHEAAAMRIAGGIAPSVSDAEEAVQGAFVKAYGALDRLRLGAPLAPWLMTIVSNEARNRRRSAGRREQLARRAAAEGREEAPSPTGPENLPPRLRTNARTGPPRPAGETPTTTASPPGSLRLRPASGSPPQRRRQAEGRLPGSPR